MGRTFELRNVQRMMQFAEQFSDFTIVSTLSTQLCWSHFLILIPLKSQEAKMFYAQKAATEVLGKRELRKADSKKNIRKNEHNIFSFVTIASLG